MRADETPAAELWSRTLFQIASLFGRLVYLASLRDANTGVYQHFGFAQRFTGNVADLTIRRSHMNTFTDWLRLSLEEQREDLLKYLDSVEGGNRSILAAWQEWPPYMNWIPVQARPADRELFRSEMEIILDLIRQDLIRQDFAGASPGRTA